RDRALVTDLVYGTLRLQGQADFLLAQASHRPLAELDAPVRAALRLGAYQLLSGVAPHAAVGVTVGALAAWPSPAAVRRAAPFANAVLRRVAGLGPDWPWPAGAGAEPPAVTLRPNPLRTTSDDLVAELTATASAAAVERGRLVPSAVVVRGVGDLARLPAVAEGRATPQDQASQAVAAVIGARPGERILDLAAAPGGKATALAEAMGDDGLVVAADLRPGRAARVQEAARRLGLRSVQVIAADGRHLPLRPPGWGEPAPAPPAAPAGTASAAAASAAAASAAAASAGAASAAAALAGAASAAAAPAGAPFAGSASAGPEADAGAGAGFDRVLLDAPCSGLGVLRRRPEARWRLEPAAIGTAAALQRQLFAAAAARVRPGGVLVYSVCTLTREETRDIDDWAAATFPDFTADGGPGLPWRPHGRGALLLPPAAGTDGMFLLRLRRAGPAR